MAANLPQPFGAYVLLKALGQGAMGDVHLARPFNARRGVPTPIVIKRLHGELASNPTFVRRFKHEAEIAVAVDSPFVAKVYDVGAVGETLYIAMEYVAGWPLSKLMEAIQQSGRHAAIASALELAISTLEGLNALHTAIDFKTGKPLGIVHRDISPKNMMVDEDGRPRLIDLGLGKSNVQDWKTRTGVVMGSVGYMPPEQVTAEGVDHRADLYSFAVVVWELLTMRSYIKRAAVPVMLRASLNPPWDPPSRHRPDVPALLDQILQKALSLRVEDRFQSAAEFLQALRSVVAPEKKAARSMNTLIEDLFSRSLPERRSEISALLSLPLPIAEDGPDQDHTVVFVQAPGVAPLAAEDFQPSLVEEHYPTVASNPQHQAIAARPMAEILTLTPPAEASPSNLGLAPPRSSGKRSAVPMPVFIASMVVAGAVCTAATLWIARSDDAAVPVIVESPAVAPEPGVVPGAVPSAVPGAIGAKPAPVEEEPTPEVVAPAVRKEERPRPAPAKRRVKEEHAAAEPTAAPPEPEPIETVAPREVTQEIVSSRVQKLLSRAGGIKSALPKDSEQAKQVDQIRAKLTMELNTSDPKSATRRLDDLEAQLSKIKP